ncbi:MAG TPA: hypothetical protein VJZ49_15510 [Syntrophales bacterium]|nr:hypothetical protein [Syntrophales bacterium]
MINNQWDEQIETLRAVNEAMRDNIRAKQELIDQLANENARIREMLVRLGPSGGKAGA